MAFNKKKEVEKKEMGGAIEDTIKSIQTKFGEGAIMKLGEKPKVSIDAIPSGSIGLDSALGVGGFPRGPIIEIFGPESSGKATLALHTVAQAQKQGGICAYIDAEHAMDPDYSKKLGVKIDELLISQPDTGEQALKFYTSVRLDIRRIAQIKKGEEVVGSRTRVKVVKNKVAAPFRQTEFDIIYNEGISKEGEIIALGEKYGLVGKTGNTYFYLPAAASAKAGAPIEKAKSSKAGSPDASAEASREKVKLGVGYDATRIFLK